MSVTTARDELVASIALLVDAKIDLQHAKHRNGRTPDHIEFHERQLAHTIDGLNDAFTSYDRAIIAQAEGAP